MQKEIKQLKHQDLIDTYNIIEVFKKPGGSDHSSLWLNKTIDDYHYIIRFDDNSFLKINENTLVNCHQLSFDKAHEFEKWFNNQSNKEEILERLVNEVGMLNYHVQHDGQSLAIRYPTDKIIFYPIVKMLRVKDYMGEDNIIVVTDTVDNRGNQIEYLGKDQEYLYFRLNGDYIEYANIVLKFTVENYLEPKDNRLVEFYGYENKIEEIDESEYSEWFVNKVFI